MRFLMLENKFKGAHTAGYLFDGGALPDEEEVVVAQVLDNFPADDDGQGSQLHARRPLGNVLKAQSSGLVRLTDKTSARYYRRDTNT